ncbi:hypothetical protein TNCV_2759811 [Trichonephila clavipes]|nr:hypothetical protein TNCV_2759811 [Trichonephila clavipes]
MSRHVAKWCHYFKSGRQGIENRNMARSGRHSVSYSVTEINTARIGELIQNDRRVTLLEISSELGLSYNNLQHIVSDVLRYSKL